MYTNHITDNDKFNYTSSTRGVDATTEHTYHQSYDILPNDFVNENSSNINLSSWRLTGLTASRLLHNTLIGPRSDFSTNALTIYSHLLIWLFLISLPYSPSLVCYRLFDFYYFMFSYIVFQHYINKKTKSEHRGITGDPSLNPVTTYSKLVGLP